MFKTLTLPILACGIVLGLIASYILNSQGGSGGAFTYGLDDAYIHMSIARHLVQEGIWGASYHIPAGASSSLLFTGLLAVLGALSSVLLFGPLGINLGCAVLLIFLLDYFWRSAGYSLLLRAVLMSVLLIVVPIASQVVSGMEVLLQCALMVGFISLLFSSPKPRVSIVALLCFMVGAVRYEMIFVLCFASIALLIERRYLVAAIVPFFGLLPAFIYGLVSTSHGGFFFPNTILLKGRSMPVSFISFLDSHGLAAIILFIAAGTVALYLSARGRDIPIKQLPLHWSLPLLTLACLVTHVWFAAISEPNQFQRYHSYLILLALISIGAIMHYVESRYPALAQWKRGALAFVLVVILTIPFLKWTAGWIRYTPTSSENIHDQQVQMANVVKLLGSNPSVLVNDIGAIGYYTNAKMLDVIGLGSDEIASLRLRGINGKSLNDQILALATRDSVRFALIYDSSFCGFYPDPTWTKVGVLHLKENFACARDFVECYAVLPEGVALLHNALASVATRGNVHVDLLR